MTEPPFITTSNTIARIPGLPQLLGRPVLHRRAVRDIGGCSGVIAWGCKPSATTASLFADRHKLALLRLEDGFLRSVGIGSQEPPLSIVLDDLGIYYDALHPSRLEFFVNRMLTSQQQERAQNLIRLWRAARISKYNHAREYSGNLPTPYILVADQVSGDASIRYVLADQSSFQRMLAAALENNPDCTIVLKTHPDVLLGHKKGHFDLNKLTDEPRLRILAENVHPVRLIEHAAAVYCVTSQIGFEGLLWGKPVHTFGMPFYAGWGLTDDDLAAPERRQAATLETLVHAALIDYPRYIDPETQLVCEPERLINWMGLQRRMRERFPANVYALGFSLYKRPIVRRFFQGSTVVFIQKAAQLPQDAPLAVWRRQDASSSTNVIALEDGFIRSVGLGADLIHPLSWAMDTKGIYYDATRPSELEQLLQHTEFDDALIHRAQVLRERLVTEHISKYNVGMAHWLRPDFSLPSEKNHNGAAAVILVPGQVESDASLAFGAPGIRKNLDLLKAVRQANPKAYIVYKPHPDVVAGLRHKGQGEGLASDWCNEIVVDVSMGKLLPQIDEVHTLTSLTGFEALLRGKKVVCYGLPFYAGWGLTDDILPMVRRTRELTLDELAAGVLVLYPSYLSRTTGKFSTPERALDELLEWRENYAATRQWWRKTLRWALQAELRIKSYWSKK